MKTKLLKIINHYGIDNQQRKLAEEVFELQKVIDIAEASRLVGISNDISQLSKENLEEEIADVCVLLMQFANYYKLDVGNIGKVIDEKIDRTIGRIKNE